jgi:hypothetical protein
MSVLPRCYQLRTCAENCYALNVVNEETWAYYYSSFTLARIKDDTVTSWTTPVSGARAIAVCDDTVCLVGGYRDDARRCVVCEFSDGQIVEQHRFRLATPTSELTSAARVAARGGSIYALDGLTVYRLTDAAQ